MELPGHGCRIGSASEQRNRVGPVPRRSAGLPAHMVPGTAEVFTPMAIRALLRDKEAAGRYRPGIEQFVARHRDQIDAALASQAN
jgi:hypothetical protein